jgi:hypothetical protein
VEEDAHEILTEIAAGDEGWRPWKPVDEADAASPICDGGQGGDLRDLASSPWISKPAASLKHGSSDSSSALVGERKLRGGE